MLSCSTTLRILQEKELVCFFHLEAAEVAVVMLKSYSVQTVLWSKISVKTVLSTVT